MLVNNNLATLGRVLFYETQLSINNRVSCGSCHNQSKGFADKSSFSNGFENGKTTRNTPAIVNPCTQSAYFWDQRETRLSSMVTKPIENHIEMGLDQPEYIVSKVKALTYYEPLFKNAFGDSEVNMDRIGKALENFVGSMVSVTTKYDEGLALGFSNFTSEELLGKQLFTTELPCSGCHSGDNFSGWGSSVQNIGLDMDYADNGTPGTDWMTGSEMDGWFKVPSLRNVEFTPPYMHDGRFQTLEEVINFYDHGVQPHNQLSFALREGWNTGNGIFGGEGDIPVVNGQAIVQPLRLNLTPEKKQALIAFLKTLSDHTMLSDLKFSDPFSAN